MKLDADTIKLLIQVLVMYGPGAVKAITDLFKKPEVTVDDIVALLESIPQKSYDDYIGGKA